MKSKSIFLIPLVFFVACKNKEEISPTQNPVVKENAYYPLAIGNYWVYDIYIVYNTGEEFYYGDSNRDSMVITKDTLINGHKYAVLEGSSRPNNSVWGIIDFIRDSSGYMVNNNHKILFSSVNFTDTLGSVYRNDTSNSIISSLSWWMHPVAEIAHVPAGHFNSIVKKTRQTIDFYNNNDLRVQDLKSNYTKGIGLVKDQYNYQYFMNTGVMEKRLVRYRTNNLKE